MKASNLFIFLILHAINIEYPIKYELLAGRKGRAKREEQKEISDFFK